MQRPVRVLVNAVSAHTGGGLTYAFEQVRALACRPELSLTVVAPEPLAGRLQTACSADMELLRRPRQPLPLRIAWEQLALPVTARRYDVVYALGNFGLLAYRQPQVVTFQNPNHFGSASRAIRRRIVSRRLRARLALESAAARMSARGATRAIAVSETLRSAIEEDTGRRRELTVVRSGVPELPSESACGSPRYALAVANDYPHKDWDNVIATFARDDTLPPLVLVGACRTRRRDRRLKAAVAGLPTGKISFMGRVDDRRTLAQIYDEAVCLVAHSRLEAFPLTPYEALSIGVPVVASDIAAHREACGAHATYYDVDDHASLARAVHQAARNGYHAEPASGLGTWEENAAAVASVLVDAART